jgi:hypothetical protein
MYRCKSWKFEDFAKFLPLRAITNKGFNYVKDTLQIPSPGKSTMDKGQLVSKCPFAVTKLTKKTNEIFVICLK